MFALPRGPELGHSRLHRKQTLCKVESVFLFLLWCNFSALCKRNGRIQLNKHLEEFFLERQCPPFCCFSTVVIYLFHVLIQSSRPKLYRPSSVQRGMNGGPCSHRSGHLWNVHCEWIPGTGSWALSRDLPCRGPLLGNFLRGRVELLFKSRAELALAMGFHTLSKEDKNQSSPGIVNEEKGKISGRAKNM